MGVDPPEAGWPGREFPVHFVRDPLGNDRLPQCHRGEERADGAIASMRLVAGKNVQPALADVLFKRVKAAGSTEVDAVSGATASGKVLLKAVAAAAAGGAP